MKLFNTRVPLVVALSTALALAAGCSRDADNTTAVDEPAAEPVATAPVDTAAPPADTAAPMTQADASDTRPSDQPASDTWITTKVKSALLADTDVAGLQINVETVNGVVTLSGDADQQSQIDEAARIAREIDGVTDVQTTKLVTRAN